MEHDKEKTADELYECVRKFCSYKEDWTTAEGRAQLYRDMAYAVKRYGKFMTN